eukprot:TRINITY_DN59264_c0_g1_i3.p2 TRINITY_DN59264_c0_g1~~TRINITY_DN59264_c0_g1_i3.p2  ORF type:complete len:106 (-),score=4.51 TRINITY_DN59264_c0_g1_i3:123-440(-)
MSHRSCYPSVRCTCSGNFRRVGVWVDARGEYLPLCQLMAYSSDAVRAICTAQSCPIVDSAATFDVSGETGTEFVSGLTCTNTNPESCTAGPVVTGCTSTTRVACL